MLSRFLEPSAALVVEDGLITEALGRRRTRVAVELGWVVEPSQVVEPGQMLEQGQVVDPGWMEEVGCILKHEVRW